MFSGREIEYDTRVHYTQIYNEILSLDRGDCQECPKMRLLASRDSPSPIFFSSTSCLDSSRRVGSILVFFSSSPTPSSPGTSLKPNQPSQPVGDCARLTFQAQLRPVDHPLGIGIHAGQPLALCNHRQSTRIALPTGPAMRSNRSHSPTDAFRDHLLSDGAPAVSSWNGMHYAMSPCPRNGPRV